MPAKAGIQPMDCRNLDSAFRGNDKARSRDTSEPLFRDEWPSLFDHPHHSTNFLEREYISIFHGFCNTPRAHKGRFGRRFLPRLLDCGSC
jgi:hypothetical protein